MKRLSHDAWCMRNVPCCKIGGRGKMRLRGGVAPRCPYALLGTDCMVEKAVWARCALSLQVNVGSTWEGRIVQSPN
jgi:hypothetical protein